MDRRVRYHSLFDCDVIAAANWYDDRSMGLGDAFTSEVALACRSVILDPGRFGRTPLGMRYARVERFPYIVLFELTDDELLMLGVLHTARSMEKWRQTRG